MSEYDYMTDRLDAIDAMLLAEAVLMSGMPPNLEQESVPEGYSTVGLAVTTEIMRIGHSDEYPHDSEYLRERKKELAEEHDIPMMDEDEMDEFLERHMDTLSESMGPGDFDDFSAPF